MEDIETNNAVFMITKSRNNYRHLKLEIETLYDWEPTHDQNEAFNKELMELLTKYIK